MQKLLQICLLALCLATVYSASAQTEVTYWTTKGSFKIMLTDTKTPITVDSFKARVIQKFYDGLIFHRVIAGFMIQGGDPLGNGTGGPGYTLPDEFDTSLHNIPGALAMANEGTPHTGGCQFYINVATNAWLDGGYTVFGMVTSGYSVVDSISVVPTNSSDKPLTNMYMDSIRITTWPAAVTNINTAPNVYFYPNPSHGIFNIELPELTKIEVMSMQGQLVYKTEAKGIVKVDLRKQPAGIYMVRVSNTSGVAETKLVVE